MDKTTKLINDKAFMKEAADIYSKNAYFSIKDKVGSEKVDGRDSNHIVLAYDKTKAKAYGEALEKTNGLKDLKSCVKDADKDPTSSVTDDSAATPKIELWVDKWSHKVNKIVVSQDQDGIISQSMYQKLTRSSKISRQKSIVCSSNSHQQHQANH